MLKSHTLLLLIIAFSLTCQTQSCHVRFSELLASNRTVLVDSDFSEFSDWIELCNYGMQPTDISGWWITDDPELQKKWNIPQQTILDKGERLLLWADDHDTVLSELHLSFKLNRSGETLYLLNGDLLLIDSIQFPDQTTDFSYCRNQFSTNWYYCEEPTPGNPNPLTGHLTTQTCKPPVFSVPGGIYSGTQVLELTGASQNETIRYTTDGSIPDQKSFLYEDPISIQQNTVIRARIFSDTCLPGQVVTHSYLIGTTQHLPVININTADRYLNSTNIGILKNRQEDWERPANIEFFLEDGTLISNQAAEIKIHGNEAASDPQPGFSVKADDFEGDEYFHYQFFDEKPINEFKSFILRNSSQDWPKTFLRDGMMQTLVATGNMNIDYQAYAPCLVYINGSFWGLSNIREKMNEDYAESNYGLAEDEIDMLEGQHQTVCGDTIHYFELLNFLTLNNIQDSANYEHVRQSIDLDEFIDYQIAQIYFGNNDWPHRNIKYWRPKQPGGKWRWMMFDLDFGFGGCLSWDFNALEWAINDDWSGFLLRSLLGNSDFTNDFVQRFALHSNYTFAPPRVNQVLDSLILNIALDMGMHITRWADQGGIQSLDDWHYALQELKHYASQRPAYIDSFLTEKFGLNNQVTVELSMNIPGAGKLKVEGLEITDSVFSCSFYSDLPVTVEAIAAPGYCFSEWLGITQENKLEVIPFSDTCFSALFQPCQQEQVLYINELMADNDTTLTDPEGEYEDWLEIYNAGDDTVDIAGYFLTDNFNHPQKHMIPFGYPEMTRIPGKGYLLLWADKDTDDGPLHLDFKLSKNGEEIGIYEPSGITPVDTLAFGSIESDKALARMPDGSDSISLAEFPSPGYTNSPAVELNLKVYLQGPFDGDSMHDVLHNAGYIPAGQPYWKNPWYYSGPEKLDSIASVDIVDWVLIELRETDGSASTATPEKIIARKAALLKRDGQVVGPDGVCPVKINTLITKDIYVVIHHRNHISIMSSVPVNPSMEYDFTESACKIYGGLNCCLELAPGKYGMVGGDGNSDGQMNNADKNDVWNAQAGLSGYLNGDFNLNGQAENGDKNDIWSPNSGLGSQVPEFGYRRMIPDRRIINLNVQ